MIIGIGTDITDTQRIEKAYSRFGHRFARRILAPVEYQLFLERNESLSLLSKRFAVKEAASKALGTGIAEGITWHDIYVTHNELGVPHLHFSGAAKSIAESKGVKQQLVTISDEASLALAFVVLSD